MKALVTFALEQEFAPWRELRGFRKVEHAKGSSNEATPDSYEAEVEGCVVRVLLTGVGWAHARNAMRSALCESFDVCIAAGLAGALRPAHRCGDVLVARAVRETQGSRLIVCDRELVHSARAAGAEVAEAFVSSDRILLSAAEKQHLGVLGDAVDMESSIVLSASSSRGIRSVAIRAIGDAMDMDLPVDFSRTLDARGKVRIGRVLAQVARRPSRLPGLIRLGRESRRAATRLAEFLDRFVIEGAPMQFRTPVAQTAPV